MRRPSRRRAPVKPTAQPEPVVQNHYVREYTVAEFIREGTTPVTADSVFRANVGSTYWGKSENCAVGQREDFLGFSHPLDAAKAANFGWAEGTQLVHNMRAKISHRLGIKNRQLMSSQDVIGGMVDVPLFLQGVPDCMINFEESDTPQCGFVHVHISAGVSAMVSTADIQRQGATVGALVDALESCNHRVKLTWERSSRTYDKTTAMITLWMVLKDYHESLDLDRLTFFLCNNAARRAMAWTNYMKAPPEIVAALDVKPDSANMWPCSHPTLFADADVTVKHLNTNEKDCAKWIIKEMERLGVVIASAEEEDEEGPMFP
jgi:hypothetical protein